MKVFPVHSLDLLFYALDLKKRNEEIEQDLRQSKEREEEMRTKLVENPCLPLSPSPYAVPQGKSFHCSFLQDCSQLGLFPSPQRSQCNIFVLSLRFIYIHIYLYIYLMILSEALILEIQKRKVEIKEGGSLGLKKVEDRYNDVVDYISTFEPLFPLCKIL